MPSDLDSVIPSTEVASLHSTPTLQQVQSLPAHFSNSTPSSGTVGMSNAPTLMAAVAVTPSVVSAVTPAVPSDVRTVQTNSVTSSSLPATMAVWLNEDWGHIDVVSCNFSLPRENCAHMYLFTCARLRVIKGFVQSFYSHLSNPF